MSKKWRYIFRAMALANLVTDRLPKYAEDKTLTIDELVDFTKNVFFIGGWKTVILIPEDMIGASLDFSIEED